MADQKKSDKRPGKPSVGEFVTVAFAEDLDLARQHKKMLEENGIRAVIRQSETPETNSPGVPVLVPEEDLDQAHALIASQASFEEFFDVFFQGSGRWVEEEIEREEEGYE